MTNEIHQAALDYQQHGYSVIPILPGAKNPPTKWMNRFFNSANDCPDEKWKRENPNVEWGKADETQINRWWKQFPNANIAIICGEISGIDCLDADGPFALDNLEGQSGVKLPDTVSESTGRKDSGKHLIFKYHGGGLKNWQGFASNGNDSKCDLKTNGGYFVAAPSIHKSGKKYEWIIDPLIEDPEPFPPKLIKFISDWHTKTHDIDGGREKVDPEKWFKDGIPDGKKHHDLFRYACRCEALNMAYDEALILTTEVARACVPPPKDGPEKAAKTRVDEAFSKYRYGKEKNPETENWGTPADTLREIPPAPEFPLSVLPTVVCDYVSDLVERLQCPADMVAIPEIIELAGLIGKDATIRPKARDSEWDERPCLWGLVCSPKSTMKSAGLKAGTKNLRRIQLLMVEDDSKYMKSYIGKKEDFDARRKALKKNHDAELKKDPTTELSEIPEMLRDAPKKPIPRRKVVNDTTLEKLCDLMVDSEGLTLYRDELSSFMLNMNRYHTGSDRQFFLECYSGGSHCVDRVGRGEQYVSDLFLNIVGGIQPQVAKEIFSVDDGVDDGFFERFGLIAYPERKKDWKLVDVPPNLDARDLMSNLCDRLNGKNWAKVLMVDSTAEGEKYGKAYVRFADHAQAVFDSWLTKHMNEIAELKEDDPMSGFIGKRRGLVARLCLVFHLAKWAGKQGESLRFVSDKTLNDVLILMDDYIIPMQERVIEAFSMSKIDAGVQKVIEWVKKERIEKFTFRDIERKQWSGLKERKEVAPVVECLISLNWLSEETVKAGPKGGSSWKGFFVNPAVK